MADYSLRLFTPVVQGNSAYLMNLTPFISDWRRSTALQGGPWMGTFRLTADRDTLERIFYEQIGGHVLETSYGEDTWEGFIFEMDLVTFDKTELRRRSTKGKRLRRSYEDLVNRVKAISVDPTDNTTNESSWYDDSTSQALYGVKEQIVVSEAEDTVAIEDALTLLEDNADISPVAVGTEFEVVEPYLEATVAGYIATAKFMYTTTGDDASSTVGDWIAKIFTDDLEFLTASGIQASNTEAITRTLDESVRAWDLLEGLRKIHGTSGERYTIKAYPNRIIRYEEWDNEPIGLVLNGYYLGRDYSDLEARPRLIKPGIYRDPAYAPGRSGAGSILRGDAPVLQTPADSVLEAVEVDPDGRVIPRREVYEPEEAYRTFVGTNLPWLPSGYDESKSGFEHTSIDLPE